MVIRNTIKIWNMNFLGIVLENRQRDFFLGYRLETESKTDRRRESVESGRPGRRFLQ